MWHHHSTDLHSSLTPGVCVSPLINHQKHFSFLTIYSQNTLNKSGILFHVGVLMDLSPTTQWHAGLRAHLTSGYHLCVSAHVWLLIKVLLMVTWWIINKALMNPCSSSVKSSACRLHHSDTSETDVMSVRSMMWRSTARSSYIQKVCAIYSNEKAWTENTMGE